MRCGCQPAWTVDRRVTGITREQALSVGCSCCMALPGEACGASGRFAETDKHPGAAWADVCPIRLQFVRDQGVQTSLDLHAPPPPAAAAPMRAQTARDRAVNVVGVCWPAPRTRRALAAIDEGFDDDREGEQADRLADGYEKQMDGLW